MLEVTEAVRKQLVAGISDQDPNEACFRIVPTNKRSYSLEESGPGPGDLIIRHEGRAVIAIELEMAENLDGGLLDVDGLPGEDPQLLLMPVPDFPGEGHAA